MNCVWMFIDGRNRRAACKIAGVDLIYRELNGEDPTAFVLSANIHRRHMTKGQRSMAVAGVVSVSDTPVTRSIRAELAKEAGVGQNRIAIALMIYEAAPDLAANVLAGSASLDEAYKTARERKKDASSEETKLADLRERHSDLADKVVEGELTLDEARAAADVRDRQEAELRKTIAQSIHTAVIGRESSGALTCRT